MKAGLHPRLARSSRAFTLIEVLVAMFIFSLVLISLYATWRVVVQSTGAALRLTAQAQRSRMAAQAVEQALTGAQLFQANAALYSFVADTSGSFGAISFASSLGESFPGSGFFNGERLRRVTFLVDDQNQLVLRQNSLLAPADKDFETHPIVLAKEVNVFQLEFWDPRKGEYAPEWLLTNQLPLIVRVTLGFGRTDRGAKPPAQLVTRVVRIPSSAVPPLLQTGGPARAPLPR
jgi:type II secretion system protein J